MSRSRQKWSEEEDAQLDELVRQFGRQGKWHKISVALGSGRTGKQCRERWQNTVNPEVLKRPWSSVEDALIFALQRTLGNRWVQIADRLEGRAENAVKNRFYSSCRRMARVEQLGGPSVAEQVDELIRTMPPEIIAVASSADQLRDLPPGPIVVRFSRDAGLPSEDEDEDEEEDEDGSEDADDPDGEDEDGNDPDRDRRTRDDGVGGGRVRRAPSPPRYGRGRDGGVLATPPRTTNPTGAIAGISGGTPGEGSRPAMRHAEDGGRGVVRPSSRVLHQSAANAPNLPPLRGGSRSTEDDGAEAAWDAEPDSLGASLAGLPPLPPLPVWTSSEGARRETGSYPPLLRDPPAAARRPLPTLRAAGERAASGAKGSVGHLWRPSHPVGALQPRKRSLEFDSWVPGARGAIIETDDAPLKRVHVEAALPRTQPVQCASSTSSSFIPAPTAPSAPAMPEALNAWMEVLREHRFLLDVTRVLQRALRPETPPEERAQTLDRLHLLLSGLRLGSITEAPPPSEDDPSFSAAPAHDERSVAQSSAPSAAASPLPAPAPRAPFPSPPPSSTTPSWTLAHTKSVTTTVESPGAPDPVLSLSYAGQLVPSLAPIMTSLPSLSFFASRGFPSPASLLSPPFTSLHSVIHSSASVTAATSFGGTSPWSSLTPPSSSASSSNASAVSLTASASSPTSLPMSAPAVGATSAEKFSGSSLPFVVNLVPFPTSDESLHLLRPPPLVTDAWAPTRERDQAWTFNWLTTPTAAGSFLGLTPMFGASGVDAAAVSAPTGASSLSPLSRLIGSGPDSGSAEVPLSLEDASAASVGASPTTPTNLLPAPVSPNRGPPSRNRSPPSPPRRGRHPGAQSGSLPQSSPAMPHPAASPSASVSAPSPPTFPTSTGDSTSRSTGTWSAGFEPRSSVTSASPIVGEEPDSASSCSTASPTLDAPAVCSSRSFPSSNAD